MARSRPHSPRPRRQNVIGLAAVAATLILIGTACGGSSDPAASPISTSPTSTADNNSSTSTSTTVLETTTTTLPPAVEFGSTKIGGDSPLRLSLKTAEGWSYDLEITQVYEPTLQVDETQSPPGQARLVATYTGEQQGYATSKDTGRDAPSLQASLYVAYPYPEETYLFPPTGIAASCCFESNRDDPDDIASALDGGLWASDGQRLCSDPAVAIREAGLPVWTTLCAIAYIDAPTDNGSGGPSVYQLSLDRMSSGSNTETRDEPLADVQSVASSATNANALGLILEVRTQAPGASMADAFDSPTCDFLVQGSEVKQFYGGCEVIG